MLRGGWRIGRVAGIPVALHPLWIVVVALLSWSLGGVARLRGEPRAPADELRVADLLEPPRAA